MPGLTNLSLFEQSISNFFLNSHGGSLLKGFFQVVVVVSFPYWRIGGSPPTSCKFAHPPHTHQIFIPLPPQVNFSPTKQQFSSYNPINSIFSCSHCSCSFLVLNSYSLDTQVMLILIDVQHSRKAAFSFEKGLNWQNHSSSGSLHLVKKYLAPPPPTVKFLIPHHPLPLFRKPWWCW